MRRIAIITALGALALVAAGCIPQAPPPPSPGPPSPTCSLSIEVDGQRLLIEVASTIAGGTPIQITITGNGAPLLGGTLVVPGAGDFETSVVVPVYGFPVTWVGKVTSSSTDLCSGSGVTEPDAVGSPVPIVSASTGTGTFVVGENLAAGDYTVLAVGLDDPDDPTSEQCRFELPTEDETLYPDRGSIPWATTYAVGPGAVIHVPVEADGYQVTVRAGCTFWLPS